MLKKSCIKVVLWEVVVDSPHSNFSCPGFCSWGSEWSGHLSVSLPEAVFGVRVQYFGAKKLFTKKLIVTNYVNIKFTSSELAELLISLV